MISEEEAAILRSEVVALQAVIMAVLRQLASERPEVGAALCGAFEEAESILTGVTVRMGVDAPIETTVGALRVIEEIRAGVIRDESMCRPRRADR